MTKEQINERKAYLISTVDAKDILSRYGIKINHGRCKGFCHNGKDYNLKVFRDGTQCFVCGKKMDIFEIVQHFEHCNYWTAFQILGGTDEVDEKTERIMRETNIRKQQIIDRERKRKEKVKIIVDKINLYSRLLKDQEPLSEEWCFCYNRWFYWMYLFEYFTSEKEGK